MKLTQFIKNVKFIMTLGAFAFLIFNCQEVDFADKTANDDKLIVPSKGNSKIMDIGNKTIQSNPKLVQTLHKLKEKKYQKSFFGK